MNHQVLLTLYSDNRPIRSMSDKGRNFLPENKTIDRVTFRVTKIYELLSRERVNSYTHLFFNSHNNTCSLVYSKILNLSTQRFQ